MAKATQVSMQKTLSLIFFISFGLNSASSAAFDELPIDISEVNSAGETKIPARCDELIQLRSSELKNREAELASYKSIEETLAGYRSLWLEDINRANNADEKEQKNRQGSSLEAEIKDSLTQSAQKLEALDHKINEINVKLSECFPHP